LKVAFVLTSFLRADSKVALTLRINFGKIF